MESSRPLAPTGEHLSWYFCGFRSFPMLSAEAERALCCRWRDHYDISAAHQLVGNHLRLVARIVKVYRGYGLPLEDLVGEGYVGMMRALCRFDPDQGVRFASYALWWVRASIQEYILHNRSNRVLRGSVPVDAFRHVALWNDDETHLEATRDVDLEIADGYFSMTSGETIHTENSLKYGLRDASVLLRAGGWSPFAEWGDQEKLFSLILATASSDPSTPCLYQQVDALQNHGKLQPSQEFDL